MSLSRPVLACRIRVHRQRTPAALVRLPEHRAGKTRLGGLQVWGSSQPAG